MLEYISSRIVWKHYRQIDLAFCVQQVFFFWPKRVKPLLFFSLNWLQISLGWFSRYIIFIIFETNAQRCPQVS